MRPPSPTADALARRLIAAAGVAQPGQSARTPLSASERALDDLAEALGRWFGPHGYHALLVRALAQARLEHPALADVTPGDPFSPALGGLAEAAAAHGAEAAVDAAQAVLAAVIALLGRVVGDDMVQYLVEPRMDVTAPADPAPFAKAASPEAPAASPAPAADPHADRRPS